MTDARVCPVREGLSYYGARWYDAQLGRFVTPDSIVPDPGNPQAFNRYSYVLNSPTGLVDPSGHFPIKDAGEGGDATYRPVLTRYQLSLVKQSSKQYGVPWQVTAGLLEAEIRLDTDWKDAVDTWAMRMVPFPLAYAKRLSPIRQLMRTDSSDFGPGIGNIHVSTAVKVSQYMATQYPERHDWQLGYHEIPEWVTANVLSFDEESIETVAAYVRMLADYRFGQNSAPLQVDHPNLRDWTFTDAVSVWHGYRYGVPAVSPRGAQGFGELSNFQNRNGFYVTLLLDGTYQGIGASDSIRGSVPSFVYYFAQE